MLTPYFWPKASGHHLVQRRRFFIGASALSIACSAPATASALVAAFAADLKPILQTIDGFISVERFESLTEKGKILSVSLWRDEAAVAAWRNTVEHRRTQAKGRAMIFADYRIRIASVIRDYGMTERTEAPRDSRAVHDAR